jgi:hypothetical protein
MNNYKLKMRKLISLAIALLLGSVTAFDRQALGNWFVGMDPDKVVLAINCGSNDEIEDQSGFKY